MTRPVDLDDIAGLVGILVAAAAVFVVGYFLFLLITPAASRDLDGRYANNPPGIKEWIRGLKDKNGQGCCDTADGYPAEVEWDNDTGKYRVRIDGEWYVVPDAALIDNVPNLLGYATVWYWRENGKPKIRCFIPGAGG